MRFDARFFVMVLVAYILIKAGLHVLYAHFGDRAQVLGILA